MLPGAVENSLDFPRKSLGDKPLYHSALPPVNKKEAKKS
jgi:hypothetical protein